MNHKGLLILILLFTSFLAYGQNSPRIGIKVGPQITFNRYTSATDTLAISNTRDDTRFVFGLTGDFEFGNNYYFSTGLLYSLRKVSFTAVNVNTLEADAEQYSLEYIEIPLTVKLYTNDIGVDSKIYLQPGFTLDFLTNWKGINSNDNLVEEFYWFDASFYIGAGYDRQIGVTNAFFVGLFYQRGLVDIARNASLVTLKNDIFGLELGFRF